MPRLTEARITSAEFRNFKALKHFTVGVQEMNVLVGPNNSGKSTIVGTFRLLGEAMRRARARTPEWVSVEGRDQLGYAIPSDSIPISLENVHTDYSESASYATFRLSNANFLELYFPIDGGCYLLARTAKKQVRTPTDFKREFPIVIAAVPVLGPLEHEEPILDPETIRRNLNTHRASRNFRNYWYHNEEGFDTFAAMVEQTWPGMEIQRPSRADAMSRKLVMFAREERIARELYWSGFGFQVWCQLLTHVSRAAGSTLLLIDEPEIYLHPDVQRQLLSILRDAGPDILLATHSSEIMGEADPTEILLIDKNKRTAQRLRDAAGVQVALDAIGSLQNVTLTQLARTGKVLFVEGAHDYKLLRRFARRLGLATLAAGSELTAVESGGFSSWEKVKGTAWGFERALGGALSIAAVYDRDFLSDEEVECVLMDLRGHLKFAHIHQRKEIENYLLQASVLQRALVRAVRDRIGKNAVVPLEEATGILSLVTEPLRATVQAQYISKRVAFLAKRRKDDQSTVTVETIRWFDQRWEDLSQRLMIVPGKEVLQKFRETVQQRWQVNLTDIRIIDEFRSEDVPPDLVALLESLESFRKTRDAHGAQTD